MGLFSQPKKKKAASSDDKVIKVSDFLTPQKIQFFSAGPSKKQVFGGLIALLDLPDPNTANKAILAREEVGSTIIAPGISLPHARILGIPSIQAALGLCPTGVVDHTARQTDATRIFVLFLGPADNMRQHLGFLAAVSALFQQPGLPERLLGLKNPTSVLSAIHDAEKKL